MIAPLAKSVIPQASLTTRSWPWVRAARQKRFLANPTASGKNFVFVHYPHRIPESQYYGFHHYRREIARRFGLKGTHLDSSALPLLKAQAKSPLKQVRLVAVQTTFSTSREEVRSLFSDLRELFPNARFAYFDWFAPTDLRMADLVDEFVDLYVKKNLLKDFREYEKSHQGDTNLTDYYGRLYGLEDEIKHFRIPPGFENKVRPGPSFITAPSFGPLFSARGRGLLQLPRPITLHARLGGKGESWYGKMREQCRNLVQELGLDRTASEGTVGYLSYLREMSQSKMTFSPFGYGEVCWRDFEAFALGSLLLKPSMDHIENTPELFIPGETYVPLRWDFSDFKEVVARYVDDEPEQRRIAANAFEAGHSYVNEDKFLDHVEMLVNDLNL